MNQGGLSVLTKAASSQAAELTSLSSGAAHNESTPSSKLLFKHELITVFVRSGSRKKPNPLYANLNKFNTDDTSQSPNCALSN